MGPGRGKGAKRGPLQGEQNNLFHSVAFTNTGFIIDNEPMALWSMSTLTILCFKWIRQ